MVLSGSVERGLQCVDVPIILFFFTIYSLGLRIGEGVCLQVGDIDAVRKRGHIRDSKGNKDRLVPLPDEYIRDTQKNNHVIELASQKHFKCVFVELKMHQSTLGDCVVIRWF